MDSEALLEQWQAIADRWGPVAAELESRAASIQAGLLSRGKTANVEDVRYLQGQFEECRALANLPTTEIARLKKEVDKHG